MMRFVLNIGVAYDDLTTNTTTPTTIDTTRTKTDIIKLKPAGFVDFSSLPKIVAVLFCFESESSDLGSREYGVDTFRNDFVVVDNNARASASGSKIFEESFGNSMNTSSAK